MQKYNIFETYKTKAYFFVKIELQKAVKRFLKTQKDWKKSVQQIMIPKKASEKSL